MANMNVLILGVTASGKGGLGLGLAKKLGGEVVSVDSMKVYRRMDIGTAKPSGQSQSAVKHHLIDVVEPSESFSVAEFLELADAAIADINGRGKPVIAVGGTALYIKAMLYGLFEGPGTDEAIRKNLKEKITRFGLADLHAELARIDSEAAERIHPNDEKRIVRAMEVFELTGRPISSFQRQFDQPRPVRDFKVIGLRREKEDASGRINRRVKKMVEAGLVEEVRGLLAEKDPLSKQAACAIGYAEVINHLRGEIGLDETVELIKKNTRKLAKGQRTWFKTFRDVAWLDLERDETVENLLGHVMDVLE